MAARKRLQEYGFLREMVLKREGVEDFARYPFSIPAVRTLSTVKLDPCVTFFIGENGSGKSTLIEALAIQAGFNAEGGSKNFNYALRPTESTLWQHLRLVRSTRRERSGFFLRAETFFNVSTEIERLGLSGYGWDNLHRKSHGEAFLWLIGERFHKQGLYILDEPEAALSPQKQLVLLRHIHDLAAGGAQFIIATHSPILMAYPGARIYSLDTSGVHPIAYEETEHYTVTRTFLEDPALTFRYLFEDA